MKKKSFGGAALGASLFAALACALCMAGCKPDVDTTKTESDWLVGSWFNASSGASFTIKSDLKFEADIYPMQDYKSGNQKARVRGRLDNSNPKLGKNEFILQDLIAAGPNDPDDSYTGNAVMPGGMLSSFSGTLIAVLTPDKTKKKFTFTSGGLGTPAADQFFGGEYTKK